MKSAYKKYAIIGGSVVAALAIVFGVLVLVKPGHKLPVEDPNSSVSSAPTAPESSKPTETTTTVGEETTTTVPEAPTKPTATTTKAPTTTKKPTTTTKQPTTTTKAPTQPVKDDSGIQVMPGQRKTPEQIMQQVKWTQEQYNEQLETVKNYKCEYCSMHNCKSIQYWVDSNGNPYDFKSNKWNCPVYNSETHYCPYCGKILFDNTKDENNYLYNDPNYCSGGCNIVVG